MVLKKPVKVLVVDDEEVIRTFMTRLLQLEGAEAAVAESGKQSLEMVKAARYDIIFVDARMPGLDGPETIKELKKISPASTYVMMTGYSLDTLLKKMDGETVEAFITKPFEIKEIVSILEDFVRQKSTEEISTILIVETEAAVSKFLGKLMKDYIVTTVETGKEALELLRRSEFDLILSDMALLDMTGSELYAGILEIRPDAKIILLTGDARKTGELIRDSLHRQITPYLK